MKTIREFENRLSSDKETFENLSQKIQDQGQKLIESHRNSIRMSHTSEKNELKQTFINEQLYLEEIEEKVLHNM